jgi:hypothetical protein
MRHIERGGRYLRVADPGWEEPLSGKYARQRGGRWNPPESFDVVYLNASIDVARAQVRHKLAPLGVGPEDLEPARGPVLVHTEVLAEGYVDAVTERGLASLGLPATYPLDSVGEKIEHAVCQPMGLEAHQVGEGGIACRSAAGMPSPGEELAYFGKQRLRITRSEPFSEWFWPRGEGEAPAHLAAPPAPD